MLNLEEKLLNVVKKETIPAVGCTEPIAVAYAGAFAKKYLDISLDDLVSFDISTSKGIFKNGKSVKIPNTNLAGLDLAGIVGFLFGNPDKELLVLDNISKESFDVASDFLSKDLVSVKYLDESPQVYVEILAKSKNDVVKVILKDSHNHIEKVYLNDELVYDNPITKDSLDDSFIKDLSFLDMQNIIENIDINKLDFIKDGIDMNLSAAETGLENNVGLGIGKTLSGLSEGNLLGGDDPTRARILTAAAADLRMGGHVSPIMTSAGSGNQGLGVIIPIYVVADSKNIEEEKLLRAVFFAHIINKYVKLYTGKLSYMCGCSIAAGIGASAGITWMLGGSSEAIAGACTNMLSNLAGMFCDGAKENCALKLSTSASEAVFSAYLAKEGVISNPNTGIIGSGIEESIANIGSLCATGYPYMDPALIEMMDR